jgi:CRISPR type III-A-associated RAMP protein Csm4
MQATAVYLTPKGAGLFRSELRSDTLWAAICWAHGYLNGSKGIEELIALYTSPSDKEDTFFISSAFPYYKIKCGDNCDKLLRFLPHPIEPYRDKQTVYDSSSVRRAKESMRSNKINKREWISWDEFSVRFCGNKQLTDTINFPTPSLAQTATTHNTIDRARLGTLTVNDSGQLFHTNENYLQLKIDPRCEVRSGLYFLVTGNFSVIEPALRLLSHLGIAGDRSSGKGDFNIDWESVDVPEHGEPNARLCLSLYRPRVNDELPAIESAKNSMHRYLQYKLIKRQGRFQMTSRYLQPSFLFFGEGSIFPNIGELQGVPGQVFSIFDGVPGIKQPAYNPHRYGHGLMLNVQIK